MQLNRIYYICVIYSSIRFDGETYIYTTKLILPRNIFAYSLLRINFVTAFVLLHSIKQCNTVPILAIECSSSTVAIEMRVGHIFEAVNCCK